MKGRLVYLDNIKVFLISYVITAHIAAAYGGIGGGRWSYIEPARDYFTKVALSMYGLVAYAFLMGMFIFISGYFTHVSLRRKKPIEFLKGRIIRLGIPLVMYYFLVGPLVKYISQLAKGAEGSFASFLMTSYQSGNYGNLGVMWFVALILAFSAAYALFITLFPQGLSKQTNGTFPTQWGILVFVLLVGLASFLTRILFPMGGDFAWNRPLGSMVFFGTSFFLGTSVARYEWLEKVDYNMSKPWFYAALLVMLVPVFILVPAGQLVDFKMIAKPGSLASLLYAYWEVIKTLGIGMISIVVFRKWFNKSGKLINEAGQSVFLSYFIHPLICMLLLWSFSGVHIHAVLKFMIVAPVALVTTFTLSIILRKIPAVRKIL